MEDKLITPEQALQKILDIANMSTWSDLDTKPGFITEMKRYAELGLQAASQPPAQLYIDHVLSNPPPGHDNIPFDPNILKQMEGHEQRADKSWEDIQKRISQPTAVSGAVWVKASDRLPEPFKVVVCKYTPDSPDPRKDTELHWGFVSHFDAWDRKWQNHQVEWLDEDAESPTAAGDGEPRETIENILFATGKFYEGQCTELADVILKEMKGAGDGKEDAVAFGDWAIENNWVIGYNNLWWLDDGTYKGTGLTTAQLYDIFKNRNK